MLTVETIAQVRREQARGKSVRAIARDLQLSRDTVTKYLRSGETEAKYERHRQPYPQLGPFLANLEELLERNGRQPARDRLDKRQLFEALRRTGYAGGYDALGEIDLHFREALVGDLLKRRNEIGDVALDQCLDAREGHCRRAASLAQGFFELVERPLLAAFAERLERLQVALGFGPDRRYRDDLFVQARGACAINGQASHEHQARLRARPFDDGDAR